MAIRNTRDYRILTNNPLVRDCMEGHGDFTIELMEDCSYRDILVKARDLVYRGHTLYTHPLSGSVKPNETPYKSVIVSLVPQEMDMTGCEIISDAIAVADKFPLVYKDFPPEVLRDFQLIDYSLLSGAIDFDTQAGLEHARERARKR